MTNKFITQEIKRDKSQFEELPSPPEGTSGNQNHYLKCRNCDKFLKSHQIQIKRISNKLTFFLYHYYCRKCDCYYFKFKFINKKR